MSTENIGNQIKVHTPNLIKEILNNNTCAILKIPLLTFRSLLEQIAVRASQLNDVELNRLMIRLTLYDIADPDSPDYDADFCRDYIEGRIKESQR